MVQNRIEPATQVSVGTPLVPARERPFEAVLNEIVGALSVAAQQRVAVSAQAGDVCFEEFGGVPGRALHRRRAAIHRTTSNTEPACGIAKCSQEKTDQRR